MAKDKIRVDAVEIKIGAKVIRLTPDELRELRDVLDDAFPPSTTTFVQGAPIYIERPSLGYLPWPSYPNWNPYWYGRQGYGYGRDGFSSGGTQMGSWQSASGDGTLLLECKSGGELIG